MGKLNLFHYLDYRKYLKDWYNQQKKAHDSYSFRVFSQHAGFKSTNFFKLVMDGDRNLTEKSITKFMTGLNLNQQEQDFFRNLVFFNQSEDHKQKDYYYQRLLQSRKFNELKPLKKNQYEYYSTWYHPVIRELVTSKAFDGTPAWLAKRISPRITPEQAEKSIHLMEGLGLIRKKKGSKQWEQTSSVITTGPEVSSLILMNYHCHLLDLSQEVLKQVPAPKRDISAMTLGLSHKRLPELKKMIQAFRQEILKFVADENDPEEVVQVDIQMFPLTEQDEGETT